MDGPPPVNPPPDAASDPPDPVDERLRGGDISALAEAFDRHRTRLWRMVRFRMDPRLAGRVDPDDVLQETYLAAGKRIDHFQESKYGSSFLWLRAMARQTLVDVHRRHLGTLQRDACRDVAIHRPYPQATSASLAIQLVGDWTSPSGAACRAEQLARVQSAIETMSETDQEILALRHFEELSNLEVAETLGIEPKAASIRYVRALRRLKDALRSLGCWPEAMEP